MDSPVFYNAKDSIYSDLKNKTIHLYGEAFLETEGIKMEAGYIMIDLDRNEVLATYSYDKDSNKVNTPVFTDGSEKIDAETIRYNFDTEKGFIEGVRVKQDETSLYMGIAKRQKNEEIHFLKGRFSTCDLEEPHYHFQLSKAILIPNKRIVSGPMNLWINGVPTFIGLPFSVIPQMEERNKGLIFPNFVPISTYGFGLQDLGYYIPINDRFQTTFYGSIYSRGSWGLRNVSDYAKRYGYVGSINLGFQQFKSGFPNNLNQNKVTLQWRHQMDPKSNPLWKFSSNVNFLSDNNAQNNLDPLNDQLFNNQFNSDVNITRAFPGKPITAGMKLSMRQNSQTQNISLTSPIVNVNVTRFFPFKKLVQSKTGGLAELLGRFGVAYNFEGQNRALFADTLLRDANFQGIGDNFLNGIRQNVTVQTTGGLFKNTWKVTPSLNYSNVLNWQQTRKEYDVLNNSTTTDTIQRFGTAHGLSMSAQVTTALYSYYRFVGKNQPLLRHVLTPSFNFQYIPNLNNLITDSVGVDMAPITYSPFERSVYSAPGGNDQALLGFTFNNTFELKRKSDKDTNTGFKKTRIIDALTLSGNYNFLAEERNLSDIRANLRVSPISWLNIVTSGTFSPYSWNDTTGATLNEYAVKDRGVLGRFTSLNFATTITLTSKESREELNRAVDQIGNNWNADYEYFLLHPEQALNFRIPWKVSFSHNYRITANQNRSEFTPGTYLFLQTVMISGDLSFTKRWKLAARTNIDVEDFAITNTRFTLSRNLHCWAMSFNWTPIGTNQSFLFSIRSTSQLFQDAKFDLRKPPSFL
ncbi:MAG: putative LPS assembly protein LptD [Crocinitomicaceae bacterium]